MHPLLLRLLPGLIVVAACLTVFGQCATFEFVGFDDDLHVTDNAQLLGQTWSDLRLFWTNDFKGQYFPISYTVYFFETWLSRVTSGSLAPQPIVYHIGNVLLHCVNALLVMAVLRRLHCERWSAVCGAIAFAVHPIQVESVAWISELRGLLAGCLGLAAVERYLALCQVSDRANRLVAWRWLVPLALFVMSLLAKSSTVALPAALAVLVVLEDVALLDRFSSLVDIWGSLQATWRRWTPLLVWLIPAAGIAIVQKRLQSDEALNLAPLAVVERLGVVGDTLAYYLWHIVVPWPLSVDCGRIPHEVLKSDYVYAAWLLPIATVLLSMWLPGRAWLLAGLAWGGLMISPVSGIIPFAFQGYSTVADRYLYLPLLGLGVVVAMAYQRHASRVTHALTIAVLLAWGGLAALQTRTWADSLALFTHAVEVNPRSSNMANNLAMTLSDRGRKTEAIEQWRKALVLRPRHALLLNNLSAALLDQGQLDEVIALSQQALAIEPTSGASLTHWALALERRGELAAAVDKFRQATAKDPEYAPAYFYLGQLLAVQGDLKNAEIELVKYVAQKPLDAGGYWTLGRVTLLQERPGEALKLFQQAIEIDPGLTEAYGPAAHCLNRQNRPREALRYLDHALQANPADLDAHLEAANSHVQLGNLSKAAEHCQFVLKIEPDNAVARDRLQKIMERKPR